MFDFPSYKNYRNSYAKIIKASKKLYFQKELTKHQSDIKKTWEILRKAINNSKQRDNSIQNIIVNQECIEDAACMANNFNKFFTQVASSISDELHPSNKTVQFSPALDNGPNFNFSNNPLTSQEILDSINKLKDKSTTDDN